jgi:hypothetical protein
MNADTSDLELLRRLWARLVGEEMSVATLTRRVRLDGGLDTEDIDERDVLELLERRFSLAWNEPAFAFSELLCYYSALSARETLTGEQVVAWVFAAFVIADASAHDATELDLHFESFMSTFAAVRPRLAPEEWVAILRRVFGAPAVRP